MNRLLKDLIQTIEGENFKDYLNSMPENYRIKFIRSWLKIVKNCNAKTLEQSVELAKQDPDLKESVAMVENYIIAFEAFCRFDENSREVVKTIISDQECLNLCEDMLRDNLCSVRLKKGRSKKTITPDTQS